MIDKLQYHDSISEITQSFPCFVLKTVNDEMDYHASHIRKIKNLLLKDNGNSFSQQ